MRGIRALVLAGATAVTLSLPTAACAAGTGGAVEGFAAGFVRPFVSLEHVSAAIIVGLLAVHLGGRALNRVPGGFLMVMILGAMMGAAGAGMPFVEEICLAAVVMFGALAVLWSRLSVVIALSIAGVIGVMQGHLHGVAMHNGTASTGSLVGLVLGMAILLGVGIMLGAFVDTIVVGEIRRLTRRL